MQRPVNYNTKQGEAVLAYLASVKEMFVTAAQVEEYLQKERIAISRPTVYRQLEKLAKSGRARKHLFDGASVFSFQFVDMDNDEQGFYHLKCEVCEEMVDLKCEEVDHVSQHVLEDHAFQINESKTVFYGKCKNCLQNDVLVAEQGLAG